MHARSVLVPYSISYKYGEKWKWGVIYVNVKWMQSEHTGGTLSKFVTGQADILVLTV